MFMFDVTNITIMDELWGKTGEAETRKREILV